jgi:uncharacterized membrane protein
MIKVEKSVVIKKPVEEVFVYSQSIDNLTKWAGMSMQMLEGSGNVVGSRFLSTRTFLGKEMKVTMEVTAFKENELWAAKSIEGPVQSKISITYAKVPEGTKVTMAGEGETKGFFKLAEGAVASSMGKSLEESLNLLKSILEGA